MKLDRWMAHALAARHGRPESQAPPSATTLPISRSLGLLLAQRLVGQASEVPEVLAVLLGLGSDLHNANLRTQLLRIIERAKVKPWDKVFQNLRASCETELMKRHEIHVVAAWIGHAPRVALRHDLQVTAADFEAALVPVTPPETAPEAPEAAKTWTLTVARSSKTWCQNGAAGHREAPQEPARPDGPRGGNRRIAAEIRTSRPDTSGCGKSKVPRLGLERSLTSREKTAVCHDGGAKTVSANDLSPELLLLAARLASLPPRTIESLLALVASMSDGDDSPCDAPRSAIRKKQSRRQTHERGPSRQPLRRR